MKESRFKCSSRRKKFNRVFRLLHHMRSYADYVNKCDGCFKSFDYKNNSRKQVKTHNPWFGSVRFSSVRFDGDYSDKRSGARDHGHYGDGSRGGPAHQPLNR